METQLERIFSKAMNKNGICLNLRCLKCIAAAVAEAVGTVATVALALLYINIHRLIKFYAHIMGFGAEFNEINVNIWLAKISKGIDDD